MAAKHVALAVVALWISIAPASARQFREWESKQDFFSANFPGEPTLTNITWVTEYGAKIPGRVYAITIAGPRTYSVTVVDYRPVEGILTASAKSCADQTDERCTGNTSFPGAGYWKNDVRGAMIYAAAKYLKRDDLKMTHYAWSFMGTQSVENNELQLTNTKDKSRTYVNIFMHHSVLYIMEETTPANSPPPGLFVQSMTIKESDGTTARHYGVYFNGPTIDPTEATTCSTNLFPRGRGDGNPGNAPNPADGANPGRGRGAGDGRGTGAGAGGRTGGGAGGPGADAAAFNAFLPPCETLPAALRFQQGPTPVPATQAPGK